MYSYSSRRIISSNIKDRNPIQHIQPNLKTDYETPRAIQSSFRSTTPSKGRRIMFANKQNNSINYPPQNQQNKISSRNYEYNLHSPVGKQDSALYDKSIIQRSTRKPLGYSRNRVNDQNYENHNSITPRGQNDEYTKLMSLQSRNKSSRKSYQNRELAENEQLSYTESSRYISRDQKNFSYLKQKDREIKELRKQKPNSHNSNEVNYRKQGQLNQFSRQNLVNYDKKQIQSSTIRTPQKSRLSINTMSNPYIEKSQILKQKIQKIGKMTPRGSIYKATTTSNQNNYEQTFSPVHKASNYEQSKNTTECSQISNSEEIQSYQVKRNSYNQNHIQKYNQQLIKISHQSQTGGGIKQIESLSKKINERLKSIISKHQI